MIDPIKSLGTILVGGEQRDAIHIAIAPVVAGVPLEPGQRIGLFDDGTAKPTSPHIGIVDPFLTCRVDKGQRFWMFLMPSSVTGMRHHWQHPSFDIDRSAEAKATSRQWMEAFAAQHYSHSGEWYDGFGRHYTADELIDFATDFIATGDKHVQKGSESLRGNTPREEFWHHYEILTGSIVPAETKDETPFCCTC